MKAEEESMRKIYDVKWKKEKWRRIKVKKEERKEEYLKITQVTNEKLKTTIKLQNKEREKKEMNEGMNEQINK